MGECGLLPEHYDHRMKRRCSHLLCLVEYSRLRLCASGLKNNNNNNNNNNNLACIYERLQRQTKHTWKADDLSVHTVLIGLVAVYSLDTVIGHRLQNQPTMPSVRPSVLRSSTSRVCGHRKARDQSAKMSRSCRHGVQSCGPSVSRVSLTRYRFSQRRYGVVDNNGDFSSVHRDRSSSPARVSAGRAPTPTLLHDVLVWS